jgi:hypothetical protein
MKICHLQSPSKQPKTGIPLGLRGVTLAESERVSKNLWDLVERGGETRLALSFFAKPSAEQSR